MVKKTLQIMLKKIWYIKLYNQGTIARKKKWKRNWVNERWIRWKNYNWLVALRLKVYSYLRNDENSYKTAKETERCVIKQILKFNDYKSCLLSNEIILKLQQRFKSQAHNVCTENINKITQSNNDDKRLETFNRVTSYPYGENAKKYLKQNC